LAGCCSAPADRWWPQPHQSGLGPVGLDGHQIGSGNNGRHDRYQPAGLDGGSAAGTSYRFGRREVRRGIFWSPRVAHVRLARLLTILSDISRIDRVRGCEDTAPTRVGRASALHHGRHRRVREIRGQRTAAGLTERVNGQAGLTERVNGQLVGSWCGIRSGCRCAPAGRTPRRGSSWRSSPLSPDDSPTRPGSPCAAIFAA
jgi:hypothetical protein